ncbi:MAG: hypothetical protein GX046_08520 [Tissierellia bacterium]|nr:hypothetical protein [Tissierellia bacterium]
MIDRIRHLRSLAIIGMDKNAGKTTVLNHLIQEAKAVGFTPTLALTSIGRDGEEKDLVTSSIKPKIYVYPGTLVATTRDLLNRCDLTKEILETTGINTPTGEVILFRAKSAGFVEIAGPSNVGGAQRVKESFLAIDPGCFYLVDGALSRKSTAGHFLTDGAILATGASSSSSMAKVVDKTITMVEIFKSPRLEEEHYEKVKASLEEARLVIFGGKITPIPVELAFTAAREAAEIIDKDSYLIAIKGVVTDSFLNSLMSGADIKGKTLVIEDATRLLIGAELWRKIKSLEMKIRVLQKIDLVALTINPFSPRGLHFDSQSFEAALSRRTDLFIYDVGRDYAT